MEAKILNSLRKTEITDNAKEYLSRIVRNEFDECRDKEKMFELLLIAYKYELRDFEEMLSDYEFELNCDKL